MRMALAANAIKVAGAFAMSGMTTRNDSLPSWRGLARSISHRHLRLRPACAAKDPPARPRNVVEHVDEAHDIVAIDLRMEPSDIANQVRLLTSVDLFH